MNRKNGLPSYTDYLSPKKTVLKKSEMNKVNLAEKAQENIGKALRHKS